MRKLALAAVALFVSFGLVVAEEFGAVISKVDGNKVTLRKFSKDKDKKAEDTTLTAVESVKVVKGKFNAETKKLEAGEAIEGGLKNEMFAKIGDKGLFVRVTTNDDGKITEIVAGGGRKKKDKDK